MKKFVLIYFLLHLLVINTKQFSMICSVVSTINYLKYNKHVPSGSSLDDTNEISLTGINTVISIIDLKHVSSVHQSVMLKILYNKLKQSGLVNTQFLLINPYESYDVKNDYYPIVKNIVGNDIEVFHERFPNDIFSDSYTIWNNVFIIDRCGRITYHIIPPWSFPQYPYIKAGILSTFFDEPCGDCQINYRLTENKYPYHVESAEDGIIENDLEHNLNKSRTGVNTIQDMNEADDVLLKLDRFLYHHNLDKTVKKVLNDVNHDFGMENDYEKDSKSNKSSALLENEDILSIPKTMTNDSKLLNNDYILISKETADTSTESEEVKYFDSEKQSKINENIIENITMIESESKMVNLNDISEMSGTSNETQDIDIPLRIVLPWDHSHTHENSKQEHKYIVLELGNPNYHGHVEKPVATTQNDSVIVWINQGKGRENGNIKSNENKSEEINDDLFSGDYETNDETAKMPEYLKLKVTTNLQADTAINNNNSLNEDFTNSSLLSDSPEDFSEDDGDDVVEHYSKLTHWINYKLFNKTAD